MRNGRTVAQKWWTQSQAFRGGTTKCTHRSDSRTLPFSTWMSMSSASPPIRVWMMASPPTSVATPQITIRFVGGNDFISGWIRRAEYGFWATHVETLMPDGTLLGAHASGGVQARPKDYDKGEFSKELFVPIPATPEQTNAFHRALVLQAGNQEDRLGRYSARGHVEQDEGDTVMLLRIRIVRTRQKIQSA